MHTKKKTITFRVLQTFPDSLVSWGPLRPWRAPLIFITYPSLDTQYYYSTREWRRVRITADAAPPRFTADSNFCAAHRALAASTASASRCGPKNTMSSCNPEKSSNKCSDCSRRSDPSSKRLISEQADDSGAKPTNGETGLIISEGDSTGTSQAAVSSEAYGLLLRLTSRLDI